jgi:hypothetical protein
LSGLIFEQARLHIAPGCRALGGRAAAILGRLTPSFVQQCEWSIERGKDLIGKALREGMFNGDSGQEEQIDKIIKWLSDLSDNKTHSRHFHYKECQ